jgi:Tol biopolymer transport system component
MRHTVTALLVLSLCAGLLAQAPPASSADVLLKAAMQKEQIDNDLPAALAQYKAIVEKFPKDPAAPKALLQMAGIYGRQGNVAAEREVYERIAREYPNSGTPAATARQRLGTAAAARLKETELVPSGKADAMLGRGRVSPDGRYISFEDQLFEAAGGTGNLAIWDVRSGQTTIVNKFSNVKPWADGFAEDSAWSPDGTQLAYAWAVEGDRRTRELRIVDRGTGRHRVVFRSADGTIWVKPFSFSPDGRHVLTSLAVPAGEGTVRSSELALISVADGTKRTVKAFDGHVPGNAVFSPDGKYVAYDFQPQRNAEVRDVSVIALDTGRESPVANDGAANEVLLGWLPDGHVLLTSDRQGTVDALVVPVRTGAVSGVPAVVKRDVGQLEPQGVTRDGRVFVLKSVAYRDVYVAELDPVTGKAIRPPAPLTRAQPTVKRSEPAFSPDGTRIAYVQSAPGVPQSVVIQTLATDELRVYPVRVRNIDWPLWHPDGRSFIFDGTGEDNVQRTFQLDLQSGAVTHLSDSIVAGVSPDGQYLYGETRQRRGLLRRSLKDGTTTVIVPVEERQATGIAGILLSPDGRWLAYLSRGGGMGGASLLIRPATGGAPRVLTQNFAAGYARLAWSPDSRYVIFNDNATGLNRISIDGGQREPLGIRGQGLGQITEKTMSADGRRLAFGVSRNRSELWVWENVIPKAKQP